jgi:hypothetical protein
MKNQKTHAHPPDRRADPFPAAGSKLGADLAPRPAGEEASSNAGGRGQRAGVDGRDASSTGRHAPCGATPIKRPARRPTDAAQSFHRCELDPTPLPLPPSPRQTVTSVYYTASAIISIRHQHQHQHPPSASALASALALAPLVP